MGERLSAVDKVESTAWPAREVIEAQRGARTMTAQAEMEVRRSVRAKYGNSAEVRAQLTHTTVSRLVAGALTEAESSKHAKPTRKSKSHHGKTALRGVLRGVALTGGIAVAGGGLAVSGVVDVLAASGVADVPAIAAQPLFLGTGLAAAAITYIAGCTIDYRRNKARYRQTGNETSLKSPATRRSLIIACGAGIGPGCALFESLPGGPGDVSLIYRAERRSDVTMLDELKRVGANRRAKLIVIVGSNSQFPPDEQPLGPEDLMAATPDISDRDIFLTGSASVVASVTATLRRMGVPQGQIHTALSPDRKLPEIDMIANAH